jgi:hypothetical protein
MSVLKRFGAVAAAAGMAAVGVAAMPHEAKAWWRGGYGVGIWVPPGVVAPPAYYPPTAYYNPPVAYAPPPAAYYGPPLRAWIPAHWEGPYWVQGHWS